MTDNRMDEPGVAKNQLRTLLLERRRSIAPADRCIWDSQIGLALLRLPEYRNAHTLLTFLSTPQEISTLIPIACALGLGQVVAAPRWGGGQMEFCPFTDYRQLVRGEKGILQPSEAAVPLTDYRHAICLVPALAVDGQGLRLGYGGGYYDRFLQDFPGYSVALAYEVYGEALPTEGHDWPVKAIVTPHGILRIAPNKAWENIHDR